MGQRLGEHDDVTGRQRHLHGELAVERGGQRERRLVAARHAHEPAPARWVVDERPLRGHQPGADAATVGPVVLDRIERCAAAVEAEPGRVALHHDPVHMVEAHVRPTRLTHDLEDGRVVDEVAEATRDRQEPTEALAGEVGAGPRQVEHVDRGVQRGNVAGGQHAAPHEEAVEVEPEPLGLRHRPERHGGQATRPLRCAAGGLRSGSVVHGLRRCPADAAHCCDDQGVEEASEAEVGGPRDVFDVCVTASVVEDVCGDTEPGRTDLGGDRPGMRDDPPRDDSRPVRRGAPAGPDARRRHLPLPVDVMFSPTILQQAISGSP